MVIHERVWAEINLDNLHNNIVTIKRHIGEKIKFMSVIKADAYGHGAVQISDTLIKNKVDYIGVATLDEGKQLRKCGVSIPILILGYTPKETLSQIIQYDLIQNIYDYSIAEKLSEIAVSLNKKAKIHIEIDTGMHRFGFSMSDNTLDKIKKIYNLPNIIIDGFYTHFATSDSIDKSFTNIQYERFINLMNKLNIDAVIHCANSGGIIGHSYSFANMVRCGILLYGLKASKEVGVGELDVKPVLSLKGRIASIITVKAGEYIGYGTTYLTNKETVVATIGLGYADGYSRLLSNKGKVLVNGKYAPIVGNICMDQFMIDITGIENVAQDDTVVLIGECGGNKITADDIADTIGTIGYEVVCKISKRVPRFYIQEGKVINILNYN